MLLSLLLSGLRWHLSGLLELPLEQRLFLLLILAGEPFPFLFHVLLEERIFSLFFCFCGPFFCIMSYEHVVVEHQPAVLYCSTASTAQHSTAQSAHTKPQKQIRAEQRATTEASRQITSTVLQYRTANTTQHSTVQPSTAQHSTPHHTTAQSVHKAAKENTCRTEGDHASKQTDNIYCIAVSCRKHSTAQHRGRPRKQADR